MRSVVSQVVKELGVRGGIFTSSETTKINNINDAFKALSVSDKVALSTINDESLHGKLDKKDTSELGKFVKTLNQNRGLISKDETTTFKQFKKNLHSEKEPGVKEKSEARTSGKP